MSSKKIKPPEKLQIAIDKETGEWVSIFDVPCGLACNCKYPDPDRDLDLVAKNRNKRPGTILRSGQKMAHFAIARGQDYKGEPSPETAIHKLAKEVFAETKTTTIPKLTCREGTLAEAMRVQFDTVEIEDTTLISEYKFRPDAVGEKESKEGVIKKLLIEFKKTHAVDENKTKKIVRSGISCIEIDLKGVPQLDRNYKPNRSGIQTRLLDPSFVDWIYNAEKEKLRRVLKEKLNRNKRVESKEKKQNLSGKKEAKRGRRELNEALRHRMRRIESLSLFEKESYEKGKWNPKYEKFIEEEKEKFALSQMPDYCLTFKVREQKYVKCPKNYFSGENCTLFDCYCCEYFYKIHTIPDIMSDYVLCSF